jgi:NAD(P)-dependent dehydrogenase (short-subunit alcohol dehydrogenase family)
VNLTRAVAIELAPDRIRVNAICPGGILTPLIARGDLQQTAAMLDEMQPWPEHGRPEDIAAAALYLASDDARFVSGEHLVVDGALSVGGGNTMGRGIGGQMMKTLVGVDRGTTGQDMVVRPVE